MSTTLDAVRNGELGDITITPEAERLIAQAEESAIQFLLDGLEVRDVSQLKALVDFARNAQPIIATLAIYGTTANVAVLSEKCRALPGVTVPPGVPFS